MKLLQRMIPMVLLLCVAVIVFWEVMANRSRRPFRVFDLNSDDFVTFQPASDEWSVERIKVVADDPSAPNLLAFLVKRVDGKRTDVRGQGSEVSGLGSNVYGQWSKVSSLPILVRLVHGYNMPDCMRLKGYKVEEMGEVRSQGSGVRGQGSENKDQMSDPCPTSHCPPLAERSNVYGLWSDVFPLVQLWRLTSDIGERSVMASAMIRATDFGGTDVDICSMSFPKIAAVLGPEGAVEGFKTSSLRHPVRSLRLFLAAKWNNSRSDLLTFLRLRQPAWASNDYLAFTSASRGGDVPSETEPLVASEVLAAQDFIYEALCRWRSRKSE